MILSPMAHRTSVTNTCNESKCSFIFLDRGGPDSMIYADHEHEMKSKTILEIPIMTEFGTM
jgi:hypothetical protein